MTLMIYSLSVFVIILFSFCASSSFILFLRDKKNIYLYFTLLILCYISEVITIYYSAFSSQLNIGVPFSEYTHFPSPMIQIIICVCILILNFIIILWVFKKKWKKIYILIFIPYLISSVYLSSLPQTEMSVIAFYTLRQIYRFLFGGLFAFFYMTTKQNKKIANMFVLPMFAYLMLNCCIIFEDYTTIMNLENLVIAHPVFAGYNVCELFLWCILSCYILIHCYGQLLTPNRFLTRNANEPIEVTLYREQKIMQFMEYYDFTKREKDIFECIINYMNNDEICDKLCISSGTAKTHIHNIYQKLNITSKNELFVKFESFDYLNE